MTFAAQHAADEEVRRAAYRYAHRHLDGMAMGVWARGGWLMEERIEFTANALEARRFETRAEAVKAAMELSSTLGGEQVWVQGLPGMRRNG